MTVRNFKDLKVWQAAVRLAVQVYGFSSGLPSAEQFGLVSQMRRCATSVPANIAEGHRRQYDNELRRFLQIALGSLGELETFLYICTELGYGDREKIDSLVAQIEENGKMLNGFISRIGTSSR